MCPERFVCDPGNKYNFKSFSSCIDAMNCHMLVGMTSGVSSESELALFVHQMIPHHQNAVNMAKALHKTGKVECYDITLDSDDCKLQRIMLETMAEQNYQIQLMRGVLAAKAFPEYDQCTLKVNEDGETVFETNGGNLFVPRLATVLLGVFGLFLAVM